MLRHRQSVESFLLNCKRIVNDCVRLAATDGIRQDVINTCTRRLERVQSALERTANELGDCRELRENIAKLIEAFRNCVDVQSGTESSPAYRASSISSENGFTCFDITKPQLEFLVSCNFTMEQMKGLLNVSVKTIQRRFRQYGIQSRYSSISDQELDDLVRGQSEINDNVGSNFIIAMLLAKGVKVQRKRVRESLLRVNPVGVSMRSLHQMQRRTYSVAGPNSLWHIDGNHKLIRWRVVIHGGVDGFSRLIVFLHASDNNRQQTVLTHFLGACALYKIPSRIRVDDGGENNSICSIMRLLRGTDHNAAIRGSSVHNQRIERLWRDMWNGATNVFYRLFYFMEDRNILNYDNPHHLWALHYVFIPRINVALVNFQQQWNNHGLRTERHLSPKQLFVSRSLDLFSSSFTAIQEIFQNVSPPSSVIGVSNSGQTVSANTVTSADQPFVSVPAVPCPITDTQLQQLRLFVDPLDNALDPLGVTLYMRTIAFIDAHATSTT